MESNVFGARLRELRLGKGLTMKEVGNYLHLSEATVSRYESGLMEPKWTTIQVLAEYFAVNPAWLFGIGEAEKRVKGGETKCQN